MRVGDDDAVFTGFVYGVVLRVDLVVPNIRHDVCAIGDVGGQRGAGVGAEGGGAADGDRRQGVLRDFDFATGGTALIVDDGDGISIGDVHGFGSRGAVTPIVGGVVNGRRARGDGGGQDGVALTGTEGAVFIRRADGDRRQGVLGDSGTGLGLTAIAVGDDDSVNAGGRDFDATGIALVAPSITVVTAFGGGQRGVLLTNANAEVLGRDRDHRNRINRDDGIGRGLTVVFVGDGDGDILGTRSGPCGGDGSASTRHSRASQIPIIITHAGCGGDLQTGGEVVGGGADAGVGQGRLRQGMHGHIHTFSGGDGAGNIVHHLRGGGGHGEGAVSRRLDGDGISGCASIPFVGHITIALCRSRQGGVASEADGIVAGNVVQGQGRGVHGHGHGLGGVDGAGDVGVGDGLGGGGGHGTFGRFARSDRVGRRGGVITPEVGDVTDGCLRIVRGRQLDRLAGADGRRGDRIEFHGGGKHPDRVGNWLDRGTVVFIGVCDRHGVSTAGSPRQFDAVRSGIVTQQGGIGVIPLVIAHVALGDQSKFAIAAHQCVAGNFGRRILVHRQSDGHQAVALVHRLVFDDLHGLSVHNVGSIEDGVGMLRIKVVGQLVDAAGGRRLSRDDLTLADTDRSQRGRATHVVGHRQVVVAGSQSRDVERIGRIVIRSTPSVGVGGGLGGCLRKRHIDGARREAVAGDMGDTLSADREDVVFLGILDESSALGGGGAAVGVSHDEGVFASGEAVNRNAGTAPLRCYGITVRLSVLHRLDGIGSATARDIDDIVAGGGLLTDGGVVAARSNGRRQIRITHHGDGLDRIQTVVLAGTDRSDEVHIVVTPKAIAGHVGLAPSAIRRPCEITIGDRDVGETFVDDRVGEMLGGDDLVAQHESPDLSAIPTDFTLGGLVRQHGLHRTVIHLIQLQLNGVVSRAQPSEIEVDMDTTMV